MKYKLAGSSAQWSSTTASSGIASVGTGVAVGRGVSVTAGRSVSLGDGVSVGKGVEDGTAVDVGGNGDATGDSGETTVGNGDSDPGLAIQPDISSNVKHNKTTRTDKLLIPAFFI
jgi:acetyltransferase-like isoleucine patch superfamily enzyme